MSHGARRFSITSSRLTSAPPEWVMERVVRPETWPEWVPEIISMAPRGALSTGDDAEGVAQMLGFRVDGRARVTDAGPTRFLQDVVIGVRMTARYEVETTADGTRITHELVVVRPEGVMGRLLAFLLKGRLKAMQRRLLTNLAQQAEQSGAVEPAPSGGRELGLPSIDR